MMGLVLYGYGNDLVEVERMGLFHVVQRLYL